MIKLLLTKDAIVTAYDPEGMENSKKAGLQVEYAASITACVREANAVVILTEWNEFKHLDYSLLASQMKDKIIFDYRNILDPTHVTNTGFKIFQLGKKGATNA